MLKTKTAPAPAVKVQETKTLKILDGNIFEETKRIKEKHVTMLDITDNDRLFLNYISYASKFIIEDGNSNDFTYYISLDEHFSMSQTALYCVTYEANTKIGKFINNIGFKNLMNKLGYTDIIIYTRDSNPEMD